MLALTLASCAAPRRGEIAQPEHTSEPIPTTSAPLPSPTLPSTAPPTEPEPAAESAPIDYAAIKPYEVGHIMIIMYHGVVTGEAPSKYQRGAGDFREDLETLYNDGFRLCSMKDVIENNIRVPAGYAPVVITFDDGDPNTFRLIESGGGLIPAPETGIAIMEEFRGKRPDFGAGATLFINDDPFPGAGDVPERLKWLVDHGYDVGNHTKTHPELSSLDAREIMDEIGYIDRLIRDALPGYEPVGFAFPFGDRPKEELRGYVASGVSEGRTYQCAFALKEGYNAMPSAPNRVGFDPMNMPRVRGSSTPIENAYDMGFFLEFYRERPEFRYISDGDPDTIAVPAEYEENLDKASLGDKTPVVY